MKNLCLRNRKWVGLLFGQQSHLDLSWKHSQAPPTPHMLLHTQKTQANSLLPYTKDSTVPLSYPKGKSVNLTSKIN